MRAQVEARLAALKQELDIGQQRLREMEAEQAQLGHTLLRISGAIQALQELIADEEPTVTETAAGQTDEEITANAKG